MSSLFIDKSRANHVIITCIYLLVRVRTLRPDSVAKLPDIVAKWRQSPKVTLGQNRPLPYYSMKFIFLIDKFTIFSYVFLSLGRCMKTKYLSLLYFQKFFALVAIWVTECIYLQSGFSGPKRKALNSRRTWRAMKTRQAPGPLFGGHPCLSFITFNNSCSVQYYSACWDLHRIFKHHWLTVKLSAPGIFSHSRPGIFSHSRPGGPFAPWKPFGPSAPSTPAAPA